MLTKRIAVAALAAVMILSALSLYSCSSYDPNVKVEKESGTAAPAQTNSESTGENNDGEFVAIGGGRDQVRDVNGVAVDVGAFARRSYELCFLLGQSNFTAPADLSIDSAVLYAFCHIYYDELWSMPIGGNLLCTATPEEITGKLTEFFGDAEFDIKLSDYYSSLEDEFEMFAPTHFGTNVYYNVDSAELAADGESFEIYTTFYKDKAKSNVLGHTVLTLTVADGAATIASLSSEY